ncbi:ANTAR domain-containing protein [Nocardioides scoriae]|nr:ANTAR domain-containing protein [Nocardioides scoriae]
MPLTPPPLPVTGRWTLDLATGQSRVSPELRAMTGCGATLSSWVDQLAPDARKRFAEQLAGAVQDHRSFVAQHAFATNGGERVLSVLGRVAHDEQGRPVLVDGVVADVTEDAARIVAGAVGSAGEHRPSIEQVKGALMATYAITERAAFELLRGISNRYNVKLALLAEQVSAAMTGGTPAGRAGEPIQLLIREAARGLGAAPASPGAGPTG